MPEDALRLIAQPADQQSTLTLVAQPAGQSSPAPISYVPDTPDTPDTWLDLPAPVTFEPEAVEPTPRSLGRVRMPVRVLFLVLFSILVIVGLIVGLRLSNIDEDLGATWFFVVTVAVSEIVLVALWVVLPRWILRRHDSIHVVKWRRPQRVDLVWGIGGLALMAVTWIVFVEIADWGNWWWTVRTEPPEDWNAFPNWWVAAAVFVGSVVMAPFIEETFFRGFILGGLNRVWWVIPSVIVSAALFSAMHLNLYVAIPFALFGLILAALYLRTRHLTAPALAHAGWNLGVSVLWIVRYGVG